MGFEDIGGSIIGGLFGMAGQASANQANRENAQRQMDFQANQSNTSYQRATADMKAAGINPMLAYMQGGASASQGASANAENEMAPLGQGISSAAAQSRDSSRLANESKMAQATTAKTTADAQTSAESATQAAIQTEILQKTKNSLINSAKGSPQALTGKILDATGLSGSSAKWADKFHPIADWLGEKWGDLKYAPNMPPREK